MSRLQQLIDQGFDRSSIIPFEGRWRVRCSQCEALVINGTPTHERGCPNWARVKRQMEEEENDEA
jgi:hypothetical protein